MTFLNAQMPFSAKLILKLDGHDCDEEFSLRIMPNVDDLRIDKILMPYGKENAGCAVQWVEFQGEDWFMFWTY
ncbi:hypothetical protein [Campylobacter majalis]|uniref:hypothetical protein n=1 Tax=Campylobacter majalis TaxID=2790656 RepID=UPI003D693F95